MTNTNSLIHVLYIISLSLLSLKCSDSVSHPGKYDTEGNHDTSADTDNPNTTEDSNTSADSDITDTAIASPIGDVVTFCGVNEQGGYNDGPGQFGLLQSPTAMATDGRHMYILEGTPSNQVRVLDMATGAITPLAGGGKEGFQDGVGMSARFDNPKGIVIDPTHTALYVSDTANDVIRKIVIATGEVTTIAGIVNETGYDTISGSANGIGNAAGFFEPQELAIDPTGTHLYVADLMNHMIRSIDLTTLAVTTLAGSTTTSEGDGIGASAGFSSLEALVINPQGTTLYVADDDRIRMIDIASQAVTTLGGFQYEDSFSNTIFNVRHMTIDATGENLYVTDPPDAWVQQINIATQMVTLLCGSSTEDGYVDGTGADARFQYPEGLLYADNAVYVADSSNNMIRKIDPVTREVTTYAGSKTPATFRGPRNAATDGTWLYVTDSPNCTVRKVSLATSEVTAFAGTSSTCSHVDGIGTAARFDSPSGIVSDGVNLYVADSNNQVIRKIVIATQEVTTIAGSVGISGAADGIGAAATFNMPQGLALHPNGQVLYVADQDNHLIRQLDLATGRVTTLAGATESGYVDGVGGAARFNMPANLVVDSAGEYMYITDGENNMIRRMTLATGEVSTFAGFIHPGHQDDSPWGRIATFDKPWGIATDGTWLYVADAANVMIRRISIETAVTVTISGTYNSGCSDGIGKDATFSRPEGIVLDPQANYLYVCDFANFSVRKVRVKSDL